MLEALLILLNFFLHADHVLFLSALRQHLNLHPLLKKREWLRKVADAKLVPRILLCILHLEIEPLLVTFSVRVYFAKQVILLDHESVLGSAYLDSLVVEREGLDSLQVATLDCRVEAKVLFVEHPVQLLLSHLESH